MKDSDRRPAWHAWSREIFGDPYLVWHDGADFTRLLRTYRDDPVGTEGMLREGVALGDVVAAQSYAELAEVGLPASVAVPPLAEALTTAADRFRVDVATALFRVTGDQAFSAAIVEVLQGARSEFDRLDAAIALRRFSPTVSLVEVLASAVLDEQYLVRYHAAATLLRFAGRRDNVTGALLEKISTPRSGQAGTADRARWLQAANELAAMQAGPA